ncbi:MAG: hypothetical protein C0425_09755 [Chlorobiaceae bacterium]|nr:hypothetical protein [Chlorobiaceae bacterium]MBA4310602.1 hypothetical protein [Chlorobiaceae bacterium]
MISFSNLDILIFVIFFAIVLIIGFVFGKNKSGTDAEYLLNNRSLGVTLFVLTTVTTWYGGILGVGEYSYRYGISSWFTQGLPYYIFALLFAIFLAKKIRSAAFFTIPEKLNSVYGKKVGMISTIFIFILTTPAPYLLILANLLSLIFGFSIFVSLIISLSITIVYLFYGGFKTDVATDVLFFVVMFIGFIIAFIFLYTNFGGLQFLKQNLPESHFSLTGGNSFTYLLVWFLIALWTFVDPGMHQRSNAAKNGNVAVKGLLISILLWVFFDFLTNSVGLYSRALLPDLENPVLAFPLLAENFFGSGIKGLFFVGLIATVLSTLNSFLFLSGVTFGKDFLDIISKDKSKTKLNTRIGLVVSGIFSIIICLVIPSVIDMWYLIGSLCIPGLIVVVISSYFDSLKIESKIIIYEIILATAASLTWYLLRSFSLLNESLNVIEPMIPGLIIAILIHTYGILKKRR